MRTDDPEKAQLFYIPVYLGRHYNWFWQQWSTPGKAWDVHKDCLPHHTPPECFWDKWDRAKQVQCIQGWCSTQATLQVPELCLLAYTLQDVAYLYRYGMRVSVTVLMHDKTKR